MSQATLAVSPTNPVQPDGQTPLFKISVLVLAIFILAGFYELWLTRSEFANRAYQAVVTNPRVSSELGAKVHVPAVLGWSFNDVAFLFGLIEARDGWGYITVQMVKTNGRWDFPELRVHNVTEKHIINLSAVPPVASPDQLHARARLYLVALGSSAQPEVDGAAAFLRNEFGIQLKVLPAFEPPEQAFDKRRHQWVAEMVVQAMARQFPDIASDLEGKLVGVI